MKRSAVYQCAGIGSPGVHLPIAAGIGATTRNRPRPGAESRVGDSTGHGDTRAWRPRSGRSPGQAMVIDGRRARASSARSVRSTVMRCASRSTRSVIVCSTPRLTIMVTASSRPKPSGSATGSAGRCPGSRDRAGERLARARARRTGRTGRATGSGLMPGPLSVTVNRPKICSWTVISGPLPPPRKRRAHCRSAPSPR